MDDRLLRMIQSINRIADRPVRIMEVCGTHTRAISELGLRQALSPNIELCSGPGCPVCVTEAGYIDTAIAMLREHRARVLSFGDLLRVPGTAGSLLDQRAAGGRVDVLYATMDALDIAQAEPDTPHLFLAVGFETTAPLIALMIRQTRRRGIQNLFFLTALKRMPPVISMLLDDPDAAIDGMICPGHVAAVAGAASFRFIAERYGVSAPVCGFEGAGLLAGIHHVVRETVSGCATLHNLYPSVVREDGNPAALAVMGEVLEPACGVWRGIGGIANSALRIRPEHAQFDALNRLPVAAKQPSASPCECGRILLGRARPQSCPLFGTACRPASPVGPCMVSAEGACAIAYEVEGAMQVG